MLGKAIVAATEAMLTTAPPLPAGPPGRIARKACFMPSTVPTMLTSHIRRSVLGLDLGDQRGDLDAGIVDQDVVAAEGFDRRGNGPLPLRIVGDVELDEAALHAVLGDLGSAAPAGVIEDVADHDRRRRTAPAPARSPRQSLGRRR